ncbi:LysM peptidoglycan-binding domain-containing protein [Taibaiella koreensis]|uniref:LysM peptidoglycan-binding domain-containing protein n=1 Tax=Taibaiella koreensis TaxID=1268548 RepID=UPI000E59B27D|nr:LysM peptidoglycan-binding domain-containing protein [Taibaiella koreensis]
MKKRLLLLLASLVALCAQAQDTLWVKQKEGMPYLLHRVKSGETLFMLSKKFSVPPAVLADVNRVNYQDGLPEGSKFRIPIDDYNFIRIESVVKSKPVFYKVGDEDDLHSISRMMGVSQSAIQRWNHSNTPEIEKGAVLQVGWIAYDNEQKPFAAKDTPHSPVVAAKPVVQSPPARTTVRDTVKAVPEKDTAEEMVSAFEQLYQEQVRGISTNEESGAAVFYPLRTKAAPGVYYAFHNSASKGTILQITNPASGKTIYAKVIGIVPNLKEYHNSIIGLSGNAAQALGARERRMFCKIRYR